MEYEPIGRDGLSQNQHNFLASKKDTRIPFEFVTYL